ncbi:MAG: 50S ribosomal protein L10 [Candidatus Kapabacteria bacterium]|jgi:large subunit ribosomal protein L10|nr:50S ribosomal protein L10 [Candidatus Kapabacteria bacterium]
MISKQKKNETVEELVDKFKRAAGIHLIDFTGVTVADSMRIRREFLENDSVMRIAKNSLYKIAMKQAGVEHEIPDEVMTGQTAIIFAFEDPIMPARIIKEQIQKFKKPIYKASVIDNQFFGEKQLNQVAALQNKQELLGSIAGSLTAPISGIVGSINAVMRDLSSLIEEVAKKQAS